MTLLEAFQALGPSPVDDCAEAVRREAAVSVVFQALERLVRRSRYFRDTDDEQQADAVTNVFLRLLGAGPRGAREGDPTDDRGVERWLTKSLGRALLDELRKQGRAREVPVDWADLANHETAGGSIDDASAEVEAEVVRAQRRLFDDIVPAIAARLQSGNTFSQTISTMREIKAGRSIGDAILEEAGGDSSAAKQARDRLYQRFHRNLRHLHEEIDRLEVAGEATPEEAGYLRSFADDLRLRG